MNLIIILKQNLLIPRKLMTSKINFYKINKKLLKLVRILTKSLNKLKRLMMYFLLKKLVQTMSLFLHVTLIFKASLLQQQQIAARVDLKTQMDKICSLHASFVIVLSNTVLHLVVMLAKRILASQSHICIKKQLETLDNQREICIKRHYRFT